MWSSSSAPRQQPLARDVVAAHDGGRRGCRRCAPTSSHCDEMSANVPLVRITPPSDPSKIWVGLPGLIDDRVLVGMDAVRSPSRRPVDVRLVRAPRRRRVLRVVRQVGERSHVRSASVRIARGVRVEHLAAVRAAVSAADALRVARLLAVLVGADHVDRVGHAGRRVDVLVVPALRPAEVDRREVRVRAVVATSGTASPWCTIAGKVCVAGSGGCTRSPPAARPAATRAASRPAGRRCPSARSWPRTGRSGRRRRPCRRSGRSACARSSRSARTSSGRSPHRCPAVVELRLEHLLERRRGRARVTPPDARRRSAAT